ncbi:hypothetical protein H4R20_001076 [Coemansia guatemalensis]|uniref:Uncharacterized protein n=1 Tax=Coemansia guatemalensis TaxID=2761395 RepID=A0A9W8LWC0_9FUNG|nr:hypothetical protein H4R20_001076 [Coemansia guatemalensis]
MIRLHLKLRQITTIALLAYASSSCLAGDLGPRQVAGVGAVATTTPVDAGAVAPVDTALTPAQAGVATTPTGETTGAVAGVGVTTTPTAAAVTPTTTPAHATTTTPTPAGAAAATTSTPKTTPTPTPTPATTKSSTSTTSPDTTTPAVPAPGDLGAAGGGGGNQPALTSEPNNVYTATQGSGGILDYGSCLEFESQCNSLCTDGIFSMNCVDGGICLCYEDTSSDSVSEDDGSDGATSSDSLAMRQLSVWGISAMIVLVTTGAFL